MYLITITDQLPHLWVLIVGKEANSVISMLHHVLSLHSLRVRYPSALHTATV